MGVCTARTLDLAEGETMLNYTLLHPKEYEWGQDNVVSDTSRTSYYLGRKALRLSLKTLLESESSSSKNSKDANMTRGEGHAVNSGDPFYSQLYDQIQATAIMKDYYGRPILPEITMGSISHKGEYAVGLAQFRSSTLNGSIRVFDDGLEALDANAVEWREECLILEEDENVDIIDDEGSTYIRGVGIDLERIDARRGKRIARKVLTDSERKELGGLEVSA